MLRHMVGGILGSEGHRPHSIESSGPLPRWLDLLGLILAGLVGLSMTTATHHLCHRGYCGRTGRLGTRRLLTLSVGPAPAPWGRAWGTVMRCNSGRPAANVAGYRCWSGRRTDRGPLPLVMFRPGEILYVGVEKSLAGALPAADGRYHRRPVRFTTVNEAHGRRPCRVPHSLVDVDGNDFVNWARAASGTVQ